MLSTVWTISLPNLTWTSQVEAQTSDMKSNQVDKKAWKVCEAFWMRWIVEKPSTPQLMKILKGASQNLPATSIRCQLCYFQCIFHALNKCGKTCERGVQIRSTVKTGCLWHLKGFCLLSGSILVVFREGTLFFANFRWCLFIFRQRGLTSPKQFSKEQVNYSVHETLNDFWHQNGRQINFAMISWWNQWCR